jgi:hypothetical protein
VSLEQQLLMVLQNIRHRIPDNTATHPKILQSSAKLLSKPKILQLYKGQSFNPNSNSTVGNCKLSSKSCGLSSLTLNMEALQTFKTSGISLPTTQHHTPEDLPLQKHHFKNLKSCKL